MKQNWNAQELREHWTLGPSEWKLLHSKSTRGRLGFALQWKFFELEHRFPEDASELPLAAIDHVASQLGAHPRHFAEYIFESRTSRDHRSEIRALCGGWRTATVDDGDTLVQWLLAGILDKTASGDVAQLALAWFQDQRIEAPTPHRLDRLCRSAIAQHEERFFARTTARLDETVRKAIDTLLEASSKKTTAAEPEDAVQSKESRAGENEGAGVEPAAPNAPEVLGIGADFNALKADPGRIGLESVMGEVAKLQQIDRLRLPKDLFDAREHKAVLSLCQRAATEPPNELRQRVESVRHTMVAAFSAGDAGARSSMA